MNWWVLLVFAMGLLLGAAIVLVVIWIYLTKKSEEIC